MIKKSKITHPAFSEGNVCGGLKNLVDNSYLLFLLPRETGITGVIAAELISYLAGLLSMNGMQASK